MSTSKGRIVGDAALSEVVTFRCTKQDKEVLTHLAAEAGYPSIGHYVRAVSLRRLSFYGQIFGKEEADETP